MCSRLTLPPSGSWCPSSGGAQTILIKWLSTPTPTGASTPRKYRPSSGTNIIYHRAFGDANASPNADTLNLICFDQSVCGAAPDSQYLLQFRNSQYVGNIFKIGHLFFVHLYCVNSQMSSCLRPTSCALVLDRVFPGRAMR